MPKLIMTKGLPGSGKTTWATEQVKNSNGRTKRVNKDDLRAMIDAGQWSKGNEKNILKVRDTLINQFLFDKFDIIVDDTNLDPKHEETLIEIAQNHQVPFEVQDFTDVPLNECLKRNAQRSNFVPEETIKTMYNRYLKKKTNVAQFINPEDKTKKLCQELMETVTSVLPDTFTQSGSLKEKIYPVVKYAVDDLIKETEKSTIQNTREQHSQTSKSSATRVTKNRKIATYIKPPHNPELPTCIIVDIDGTLAHITDRSPYDYSKVSTDVPDENVVEIVRRYASRDILDDVPGTYVIIVSGRENDCQAETLQWLADNNIPYDELYMREAGDYRDDRIVKKEIYETWIKPRFNVRFVLDDRDRVVKMWREEGLKVLQVAEGDF